MPAFLHNSLLDSVLPEVFKRLRQKAGSEPESVQIISVNRVAAQVSLNVAFVVIQMISLRRHTKGATACLRNNLK